LLARRYASPRLRRSKGATKTAGLTIACIRIYDSRIGDFSPETYPDDVLPTVIILADDEEGDGLSRQNGGPPFKRLIRRPGRRSGTAFVPGYPATDAENEASLDLLEF
jgi:hypothetical protein